MRDVCDINLDRTKRVLLILSVSVSLGDRVTHAVIGRVNIFILYISRNPYLFLYVGMEGLN